MNTREARNLLGGCFAAAHAVRMAGLEPYTARRAADGCWDVVQGHKGTYRPVWGASSPQGAHYAALHHARQYNRALLAGFDPGYAVRYVLTDQGVGMIRTKRPITAEKARRLCHLRGLAVHRLSIRLAKTLGWRILTIYDESAEGAEDGHLGTAQRGDGAGCAGQRALHRP